MGGTGPSVGPTFLYLHSRLFQGKRNDWNSLGRRVKSKEGNSGFGTTSTTPRQWTNVPVVYPHVLLTNVRTRGSDQTTHYRPSKKRNRLGVSG